MNQKSDNYTNWMTSVFNWLIIILSSFSIILGAVVLIGWYSNNTLLIQIHPSFVPMQFNTGLGFVLGGIGMLCLQINRKTISLGSGALVGILGFFTLLQYITNVGFGIDQFFMEHYITTKTSHPGRMAPNTAVCFVIVSCFILVRFLWHHKSSKLILGILSLVCASMGLVSLISYITKVEMAFSWGSLTGMAFHTAVGFVALGVAAFIYSWKISVEKVNTPSWFYISIAIASSTITLLLWQAINNVYTNPDLIDGNLYVPSIVLVIGLAASFLLAALSYYMRQIKEARTQLEIYNRKITKSNKKLEYKVNERTQELTKSNEELDNLVKTLDESALVSITDKDGKIIYVNDKFCEISEYTKEELLGQNHRILKSGKQPEGLFVGMWKAISMGRVWKGEILNKKKGGDYYWVATTINPHKNAKGEIDKYIAVRFDITDQKKQQEELIALNNLIEEKRATLANSVNELHQYKHIVSNLTDKVALVDENYIYRVVNDSYLNAFGLSYDKMINQSIAEVFGEAFFQEVIKPNADRCLNGEIVNFEEWFSFPNEGRLFMEVNYLPYEVEGKGITGMIINARDITERKVAQDKLEKTNEELGHYAYVASHDLQEPLRVVTSYMELLDRRYASKLDEKGVNFIKRTIEASNRMKALIKDLLLLTRMENRADQFKPVNTNSIMDVVMRNIEILMKDQKAQINYSDLPEVVGDKTQLQQLFQNLVQNGIKFSKKGENPQIEISTSQKGNEVEFAIKDNGIGIDEKHFERIFVIFQRLHGRTDYKGTGIGLAMCKKIVEQHEGKLWVKSEPEKGSTFYFTLPLNQKN